MKKILFFCLPIFVLALCFSALIFLPRIAGEKSAELGEKEKNESEKQAENADICLEVWQTDTFEGGTGSRRAYLEKLCNGYCKTVNAANAKNKKGRVSVSVKQTTATAAEEFFGRGVYPDLISFGAGLKLPYERLVKLDGSFGLSEYGADIGVFGNERYAAVWAQGAYAYITRKGETSINSVIVCEQDYANPLLCYKLSGGALPEKVIKLPAKEAVYEFYRTKNCAMIGTQRDLYRLENKIEIDVKPLSGYSDLFACVSVVSGGGSAAMPENESNYSYAESARIKRAVELLRYIICSEKSDPSVIGLLDNKGETKNKSAPIGRLNGYKPEYGLSVFTSTEQIKNLKKQTEDFASCEQNIKSALKRLK